MTAAAPSVHTTGRFRHHTRLRTDIQVTGAPSTTNQARILNPGIIGSPSTDHGIAVGEDQLSGSAVFHDVFNAYREKRLTSPNVVVVGALGSGKSALIKSCYVLRPLMLLDRRCVVIDKKPRGDEADGDGEYSELTRVMGAEPFRMLPGDPRSTCLSPLDPLVLAGGNRGAALSLLATMASLSGDEGPLSTFEHAALRTAHRALLVDFEERRVPVIEDLLGKFPAVVDSDQFKGRRDTTLDAIDTASLTVQVRMERLLADDLSGMFDRETSPHVKLNAKLTTFNISNLPENGPATPMVIAMVNAWLMGMLRRSRDGKMTTLVIEEAWNLLDVAAEIRANAKLARALGLSLVAAFHHLSDVPAGSDGMALIREAQTVHLYRQDRDDDITDCTRTFGLDPSSAHVLQTLPQGHHLMKIGSAQEIHLRTYRTAAEVALTETDAAMLHRATR